MDHFQFFGGETFVRLYFSQCFNIDACFVASMSENVCILIEIAGKRPCQDMCFLFSSFSLLGGSEF